MSNLAIEVRRRAGGRYEYYRIPEVAFRRPFHIEHIIAKQQGGLTDPDNLALACGACDLRKGPNLTGIDPQTREVTPLFHPWKDRWKAHFPLLLPGSPAVEIKGRTPIGRRLCNYSE